MRETREICGVTIELIRDPERTTLRIGSDDIDANAVAALEVSHADWTEQAEIGEFQFSADGLRELKEWIAGPAASAGTRRGRRRRGNRGRAP